MDCVDQKVRSGSHEQNKSVLFNTKQDFILWFKNILELYHSQSVMWIQAEPTIEAELF